VLTESSLPAADADSIDEIAGRSLLRTAVMVGALATIVAATILTVAYVRRRRAEAASQPEDAQELVAVPIEVSEEGSEEAIGLEQEAVPSEA
jgi:hypothetical protein